MYLALFYVSGVRGVVKLRLIKFSPSQDGTLHFAGLFVLQNSHPYSPNVPYLNLALCKISNRCFSLFCFFCALYALLSSHLFRVRLKCVSFCSHYCFLSVAGWSTAGCDLRGVVNDTIICECNHMTNFAALVVSNLSDFSPDFPSIFIQCSYCTGCFID